MNSIQFDRIKSFSSLQQEFIIDESNVIDFDELRLSYLKHRVIPGMNLTMYEIEIDKELHLKMRDTDMKHFYHEFTKRVHNNLLMYVYHIFSEEFENKKFSESNDNEIDNSDNRAKIYKIYILFERSEIMAFQCLSPKHQLIFSAKRSGTLEGSPQLRRASNNDVEKDNIASLKYNKYSKRNSEILSTNIWAAGDESILIQSISFYYDVMSLLDFLENKKYHFSYYLYLFNPYFLFISRLEPDEKFIFQIKHTHVIKFLILPEPLLEFFYRKQLDFFYSPIKRFFFKISIPFENDPKKDFEKLKSFNTFFNIYVSSTLFIYIEEQITESRLNKQALNLKREFNQLLQKSISHYIVEKIQTKENLLHTTKHFFNSYYKELKTFLSADIYSQKIKQIFMKIKSRVYQSLVIREVTQKHILETTLENTNPLVKTLQFHDCKINADFFKDFTVAFQYLEELTITNVQGTSKGFRLEEKELKLLLYSGKMKNLRTLDLTGNSIKLTGPLFVNKQESAKLREKALPNIISLNLSGNELQCKDCHRILQEPVFENVRKIDLSRNSIDFAFQDEHGYCLLAKLETLKFSHNQLKDIGSQKLFESFGLENLRKLELNNNKIANPLKISHLINLRELRVDDNMIDSSGCQNIFENEYLKVLEILSLAGNNIKIPIKNEKNVRLSNLKKLILSRNKISSSQIIFESKLDNLVDLDLSNNEISIPVNSSNNLNNLILKNLKHLNLSFNHISDEGSSFIFSFDFCNLIHLNLNFNEIWEPVGDKFLLKNLIKLEINNNRITDTGVQGLFSKLDSNSNLLKLDLQRNKITEPIDFKEEINESLTIENINFNFNNITSEGSKKIFSWKGFENLKRLTLACNKIINPVSENLLISLNYLSLANNKIDSEGSIRLFESKNFNSLQYLDLYKNNIEIPCSDNSSYFPELIYLDLSYNKIKDEGSQLIFNNTGLKKLQNIIIDNNLIVNPIKENHLPSLTKIQIQKNKINSQGCQNIFKAKNLKLLKKLYLDQNEIEIPCIGEEGSMSSIYKISLRKNKLNSLGCQSLFENSTLQNLEVISVSRNCIEIPINCSNNQCLKKLRRLNLSFNPILSNGIWPIFASNCLSNLETLKIEECQLETLIKDYKNVGLKKLRYLLASSNKITSEGCHQIFLADELKNLQILDLCNNKINQIFPNNFEDIISKPKLFTLLLSRNRIDSNSAQILFSSCKLFPKLIELDLADNEIQNIDLKNFNLYSLAQLNLIENNLNCESNCTVDELSERFKIFY